MHGARLRAASRMAAALERPKLAELFHAASLYAPRGDLADALDAAAREYLGVETPLLVTSGDGALPEGHAFVTLTVGTAAGDGVAQVLAPLVVVEEHGGAIVADLAAAALMQAEAFRDRDPRPEASLVVDSDGITRLAGFGELVQGLHNLAGVDDAGTPRVLDNLDEVVREIATATATVYRGELVTVLRQVGDLIEEGSSTVEAVRVVAAAMADTIDVDQHDDLAGGRP